MDDRRWTIDDHPYNPSMFVSAILAAGGRGVRLGGTTPKQLLPLGDRTILQRSFDTLDSHERINEIIVALPTDLAATPPAFLTSGSKWVRIVDGGQRRHDSVANAFARISPGADVIVIHDAARPFATGALFSRVIDAAAKDGAAIAALQSSDTVKEGSGGADARMVKRTIDRDSIYLAQTPQAFARKVLAEAISLGKRFATATDEASLVEKAGYPVRLVEGEAGNIKITTAQDLRISEALVGSPKPGAQGHPSISGLASVTICTVSSRAGR